MKLGRLFTLLCIALAICLLMLPAKAEAATVASGTCGDNLTWTLDDAGLLTISGTGPMVQWWHSSYTPWYSNSGKIKTVIIEDGVTTIGDFAFSGCDSLTSITIPDSVTTIGDYAFSGCDSLTSVTIGDSVTTIGQNAFYCCTSLTSVTIGDSVTTIGDWAFCSCEKLTAVTIPDGVTTIGDNAFGSCYSLTSVTIPDSVTTIGADAFSWCTSLTGIHVAQNNPKYSSDEKGVLFNKSKTELIRAPGGISGSCTIPASVTTIGDNAFDGCNSLTGIWVNENNPKYSSDEKGVLFNKSKTELIRAPEGISGNYTIPDSVTTIGERAFYSCSSLTTVNMGDSVTAIGDYAFLYCGSLTSITIPDSVEKIGHYAFGDTGLSYNVYDNAYYLGNDENPYVVLVCVTSRDITSCNISSRTKLIAREAFAGCQNLTNITIPASVRSIDSYAFDLCTNLTQVTISEGVTSIGSYAFSCCIALERISLPDSLTIFGGMVFEGCSNLSYNTYDTALYLGNYDNPYMVLVETVSPYTASCRIASTTKIIAGYALPKMDRVTLPDGVKSIGVRAFDGGKFSSITIPASVTSIDDYAFSNCSYLTSVTIPDSVTSIGDCVFSGCTKLSEFYVSSDNEHYTCDSYGVLFNKDKTELICAPSRGISGAYALPGSVKYVEHSAFSDCKDLTDIWYVGSENDRSSITILSGNQYLENAVWHYNCCSPSAHSYDNACDTVCNICGFERAVLDHIYTNSCDTTCDECGAVRSIIHTYDNACDAVCNICGFERAVPDHIYTNSCDKKCNICSAERSITHTFDNDCDTVCNICSYQRKVAHFYDDADDVICNLCTLPRTPAIPEMVYVTDSTVTLVAIAGYEYSKNGTNWQNSNIFTGLQPNTSYKFYQRVAASAINLVSAASLPLSVTTNKHVPDIPEDFTFLEITDTSVRLNEVPGCEYSMDGIYWQTSPVFTGLTPSKQYTFYQRVAEDNKNYASGKVALQITTRSKLGTVTYDPNGGENAPESTTGIISKQKPTRSEYVFLGWALKPNTYAVYKPGDSYSQQEDVILYAVWLQECLDCHGDMKVYKVCSSCKGTGVRIETETCSSCGGDGSTYSEVSCPVDFCHFGTLIWNGEYIGKCSSCGGDGVFELPTDCSSCKGKGKIINEYTCRNCAGEEAWLVDCSNCTTGFRPCTPETPEAPQLQNVSNQTVVLAYYSTCEYSRNGVNWQSSNIFTNLSPNTTYVFYQRYKATDYNDSSKASPALQVTTLKESTLTPQPPVLQSKTYNKVVLEKADGCEYSMDGVNWQTSNVFDNLFPSTSYTFYCRFAESNTHLYSNVSDGLEVVTAEFRLYTVVFQNWDGTILSSNTYYWGDPVAVPEDPAVPDALGEKYVFSGWDKKIVSCSGDATYTAVFKIQSPGDIDCNKTVTTDDVVALLLYISMPDMFPLGEGVNADFTGDGAVTTEDAVQLLLHISMPDVFPLEPRKKD